MEKASQILLVLTASGTDQHSLFPFSCFKKELLN
jgi:hypothetical protein